MRRSSPAGNVGGVLTPRLERYVRAQFDPAETDAVLAALREWRIPYEDEPPDERLIAAVVFLAEGRRGGLAMGFDLAATDWRDLLMAAGLGGGNWRSVLAARLD